MTLIKKYDKTLRNRVALRAVWLPGTEIKVGDIMLIKDGALLSLGNLIDENISYTVSSIGEAQSLNMQSKGVSQSLVQNGARISLAKLDASADAELKISFNSENSYFLRTPSLKGYGMNQAMKVARKVAKLPEWDHLKNYVVLKVWRAEDFSFLGTLDENSELSFQGKGECIRNMINKGISTGVSRSGSSSMNLEIMGKSGPIVMQVFRVKRNGDIF